jgi:site-specific recombinase XerD
MIRNYINYLKNDRSPYQSDEQRERTKKGLSVFTINIRLRNLKGIFRFLADEGIINKNPTGSIPLVAAIAKNRKHRDIPISREISKRVKQLLDETEQYFGKGFRIFMNAYGEDFTADAFRRRLNRLKKKLEIPKLHSHMFRHKFARTYILNGGDVFTLQKILDHADILTTRKYIQIDSEHIKQQHNKFSPIRRLFNRKILRFKNIEYLSLS